MTPTAKPRKVKALAAYYDTTCNLCTSSVRLARRFDPTGNVDFQPLDSEAGRAVAPPGCDSIVVVDGATVRTGSDAVVAIGRHLRFPIPLFAALVAAFPRGLRDRLYHWVAANRYRWFGRCEL
jgi:predicted DCC family thiol-disulfide oxidoreductase YuxK